MTKYLVMEIQTWDTGAIQTPTNAYDTRERAESKYHDILSKAAVGTLPVQAAVLLTNEGYVLETKHYEHAVEPETPDAEG